MRSCKTQDAGGVVGWGSLALAPHLAPFEPYWARIAWRLDLVSLTLALGFAGTVGAGRRIAGGAWRRIAPRVSAAARQSRRWREASALARSASAAFGVGVSTRDMVKVPLLGIGSRRRAKAGDGGRRQPWQGA